MVAFEHALVQRRLDEQRVEQVVLVPPFALAQRRVVFAHPLRHGLPRLGERQPRPGGGGVSGGGGGGGAGGRSAGGARRRPW
ncbi:hypothetical protein FLW53_07395 [Microbispora sp. SCL1-1]|nr:hypothetical protein FLW53_07395 [Microbispora sp. SCL1-1]